jgi:hypothetical protein
MEHLIVGRQYYVKEYSTTIDKVVFYGEYRAQFLGIQPGINKYIIYNNINDYKLNYRPKYQRYVLVGQNIKMESLKEITNEMLPNDILLMIEEYI